jgi:four helix bundle protein
MSDFKKLVVWQKAHELALHAYHVAAKMRHSRDTALRSQLTRSAMSVPTNIVEGRRQQSEREFARFLRIAFNSAVELEYHLMLARDLGVMDSADAQELLAELIEVRKMLHGLIMKLGRPPRAPASGMKAPSA